MLILQEEYGLEINEYKTHKKLKKYLETYKTYRAKIEEQIIINFFTYDISLLLINNGNDIHFFINEEEFVLKTNESIILFSSMEEIRMILSPYVDFTVFEFKAATLAYFYSEYIDEKNIGFHLIPSDYANCKDENTQVYIKNLDEILLNKFVAIKIPFSILSLVSYLEENNGLYDIESVLLLVNVPRRVLDKAFRLYVGMSVKTYASIIKLKCKK